MTNREIRLKSGQTALVDSWNHRLLSRHAWYLSETGLSRYARTAIEKRMFNMHTLVMGPPGPGLVIDHIDRNGLNNTEANLRFVSRSANSQNCAFKRPNASSRFRGVTLRGSKQNPKWFSYIRAAGVPTNLGHYRCEVAAARAYDAGAIKHFGADAFCNAKAFDMSKHRVLLLDRTHREFEADACPVCTGEWPENLQEHARSLALSSLEKP